MNEPLYKQIYESIVFKIKNGEYAKGDRIPSEKKLAEEFNVSRITSKNALDLLAKHGMIERIQGKGSFVKYTNVPSATSAKGDSLQKNHKDAPYKIGLVIAEFSDSYGAALVKSVVKYATLHNANVFIKVTYERMENEEKAIDELLDAGVDGMIILPIHGEHYNQKILELILKKFPIVLVDRHLRGILASSIATDNIRAAKEATEYLFQLGHEDIAYITPPYDGTTVLEDRTKGFQLAYSSRNKILDPNYIVTSLASDYAGDHSKVAEFNFELDQLKQFILEHPKVSAFLTCRYVYAEILESVIHSLNKRIPDDYSVICFDSPLYMFEKPPFTHIHQKEDELGKKALDNLLSQIQGEIKNATEFIGFCLVEGHSTAPIFSK